MNRKERQLNYIMKKKSNLYWYFIDYLAYKFDRIDEIYYNKTIGPEYIKEIELFGITKKDKVLHIGCGAYPITALTIAKEIGANIVGIDKNQRVIKSADDVVKRKNLQDKIKILYGNGINYPVKDFNVIIVSSCASPKIEIVKNIYKNVNNSSKVIIREEETLIKPLNRYFDSKNDIIIEKEIKHNPFPFYGVFGWISYLVKKI